MSNLLENLNEKQKEAVLMTEGPVMAIAGAGSGKTSVLTRRIAYLIMEKFVHPNEILALTFTNKAANEMRKRILEDPLYVYGPPSWVSTFHAMCVRILREHHLLIGYRRNFQILDDDDTTQLVKSKLKDMNLDLKMYKPKEIKGMVQKLKMKRLDLGDYDAGIQVVVRNVFNSYEESLRKNHLMDFDDLLLLTIKLLKENEDVKKAYKEKFKYLMIDEFQDTNDIQYELVKLLLGDHNNLFIVGDEDQSIYKFRGANIKNITKFKTDFKDFHLVLLEQNYRSTNNILEAANNVIVRNKTRVPKTLFSDKGKGEKITVFKGTTSRDEVEFVAMKIHELVRKGYVFNDFAILYRANNASRSFEDVFMQKHVPYRIFGNTSFFKRKEIKDLTAYLRIIMESDDEITFERVISAPKRGIGKVTLGKLFDFKNENAYTMFDAIRNAQKVIGKSAHAKLIKFVEMIEKFRKTLVDDSFNYFIDEILTDSGYLDMLESDEKKEVRIENLMEYKTMLAENEKIYSEFTKEEMLMFLLEEVTLKTEEKQADIEDGVTMLTLHAAKGLEFRVVFIVNMENGIFPSSRVSSQEDLEEERRLMYVGVTRAKEKLFLTNANIRMTFGDTKQTMDSMFIKEIGDDLIEIKGYSEYVNKPHTESFRPSISKKVKEANRKKRLSLENRVENELNKGEKVTHKVFGDGIVVSVAGDNCIIAFKQPHGIKKLLKDHPAIVKL